MSLSRILEPEVMDTPEEATDYNSMDHRQVNRQFVEDFLSLGALTNSTAEGEILDLGTGTAQIPIELCRQCDQGRIIAVDLSVSMLELARYNLEIADLTDRIMLELVDAKKLPYPDLKFSSLISNSIIHHIPNPLEVILEAVRVVASGGTIFIRDLLRPQSDAEVKQLVQTYAGEENQRQQGLFDASLRAALSLDEIREMVATANFDPTTIQATSDRHWTWAATKP